MKTKPLRAWAIKSFRGHLMSWSTRHTRWEAIGVVRCNFTQTWRQLYRKGWRAVRVQITEEIKLVRINEEEKARLREIGRRPRGWFA